MYSTATHIHAGMCATRALEDVLFPAIGNEVLSEYIDRALLYREVTEIAEASSRNLLGISLGEAVSMALHDAGLGPLAVSDSWSHVAITYVFLHRLCQYLAKLRMPSLPCPSKAVVDIVQQHKSERDELLENSRAAHGVPNDPSDDLELSFFFLCDSRPAQLGLVPYGDALAREPFPAERDDACAKLGRTLLKAFDSWALSVDYRVVDGVDVTTARRTLDTLCQINAMADQIVCNDVLTSLGKPPMGVPASNLARQLHHLMPHATPLADVVCGSSLRRRRDVKCGCYSAL